MAEIKTRPGTGRMRGRTCVISTGHKRPSGFKGKGSTTRFLGCYTDLAKMRRKYPQLKR